MIGTIGSLGGVGGSATTLPNTPYLFDLNGDGKTDVLWMSGSQPSSYIDPTTFTSLWINTTTYGHAPTFSIQTPVVGTWGSNATPPSVAGMTPVFGDFLGNGNTDILWANGSSAQVWMSLGNGGFEAATVKDSSGTAFSGQPYVGNFNGDDRAEILSDSENPATTAPASTGGTTTGTTRIWTINATDAALSFTLKTVTSTADTSKTWHLAGVTDFNGDGKADVFWMDQDSGGLGLSNSEYRIWQSQNTPNDLLQSYDAGLSSQTANPSCNANVTACISYGTPADYQYYLGLGQVSGGPTTSASYPLVSVPTTNPIVTGVAYSNGNGGSHAFSYAYGSELQNQQGRGSLGFGFFQSQDIVNNIFDTQTLNQTFPLVGLIWSDYIATSSQTLSAVSNNFTSSPTSVSPGNRYTVSLSGTTRTDTDLDGSAMGTTSTSYSYDSYGNPTKVTITATDPTIAGSPLSGETHKSTTNNLYFNNTYLGSGTSAQWMLGRLACSQTTKTHGTGSITRTSDYLYDPTTGLVTRSVIEPDSSQQNAAFTQSQNMNSGSSSLCLGAGAPEELVVSIGRDPTFGVITSQTSTPSDGQEAARTTSYKWTDGEWRFPTQVKNGLGQISNFTYNVGFGGVWTAADPNTLTSTTTYDAFGRVSTVTKSDQTQLQWQYNVCLTCTAFSTEAFNVVETSFGTDGTTQNAPTQTVVYDPLSRVLATQQDSFDGTTRTEVLTQYDADFRVSNVSNPVFVSGSPVWTVYSYDGLSRVQKTTHPDNSTDVYGYHGLEKTSQNGDGQMLTQWRNRIGQVVEQIDTVGNVTGFTYDGFSDLIVETDPLGNTANFSYDSRGHMVGKQDLNGHNWGWTYDSFGEPITSTSPIDTHNGQTTSMVYDVLGRLTKRTEPDLVSKWVYDTATGGPSAGTGSCIGRLSTATATGAMTVSGGYSRQMTYDNICRPRHTTVQLGSTSYTTATTFDSGGRPSQMNYPDGFSITNDYNAQGYWSEVDGPGGTSQPIDTVTQRDAWLHPLQSVTGDQVATHRAYDPNFGRIQIINTYPAGSSSPSLQSVDYNFDSIGNLQTRTDNVNGLSETYTYDPLNELTQVAATTTANSTPSYNHFDYEQVGGQSGTSNPDGTYRVSVKASVGNYSYTYSSASSYLLAGVSDSWVDNPFSYDIDGNTLTDESARTYTWTSFDMPSTIQKGSTITYFAYDPEHRRIQQGTTTSSSSPESNATPTVNYFWVGSAHFEQVLSSTGSALWRDYVSGPDGSMASYYNGQLYYIHGDHQNSSNVETQSNGNFNSFSGGNCYDPWGKRRFCTGAADSGDTLTGSPENTRGYTGEEQLDAFDLVHLNNRLYDPEIGRFVSQDPTGLAGGQNPYAYTGNNPMSRTDRNGLDDVPVDDQSGNPPQMQEVCVCGVTQFDPFDSEDPPPGLAGWEFWAQIQLANSGLAPVGGTSGFPVSSPLAKLLAQNNSATTSSSSSSADNQTNGCGSAGNCSGDTSPVGVWAPGGWDNNIPSPDDNTPANDSYTHVDPATGLEEVVAIGNRPPNDLYGSGSNPGPSFNLLMDAADSAFKSYPPNLVGLYPPGAWLRGILIHSKFAASVTALGPPYAAEVSYLRGVPVPYGTSGSIRADAIYGPISSPLYAVELKSGLALPTPAEIAAYQMNLPLGTHLYEIVEALGP